MGGDQLVLNFWTLISLTVTGTGIYIIAPAVALLLIAIAFRVVGWPRS